MVNQASRALFLADFVVTIFTEMGKDITHLKLQKILYYIEGWSLATLNQSIILDDFEAWVNGPVCRAVYDKYNGSGFDNIAPNNLSIKPGFFSKDEISLINQVISHYGNISARDLVALTHSEKPWIDAREGLSASSLGNKKINQESMSGYFKSLLD